MSKIRKYFLLINLCLIVLFSFSVSKKVEAKKYYSLSDIGLKGCTTDFVDYAIISIRGNKVKYAKYKLSDSHCGWEQTGGIKSAILTSNTKYYIGDAERIPNETKSATSKKKNKNDKMDEVKKNLKRNMHLPKKVKNIDTQKWLYRVRKGKAKRNIGKRNNEIVIKNGKVSKLAIRLTY